MGGRGPPGSNKAAGKRRLELSCIPCMRRARDAEGEAFSHCQLINSRPLVSLREQNLLKLMPELRWLSFSPSTIGVVRNNDDGKMAYLCGEYARMRQVIRGRWFDGRDGRRRLNCASAERSEVVGEKEAMKKMHTSAPETCLPLVSSSSSSLCITHGTCAVSVPPAGNHHCCCFILTPSPAFPLIGCGSSACPSPLRIRRLLRSGSKQDAVHGEPLAAPKANIIPLTDLHQQLQRSPLSLTHKANRFQPPLRLCSQTSAFSDLH